MATMRHIAARAVPRVGQHAVSQEVLRRRDSGDAPLAGAGTGTIESERRGEDIVEEQGGTMAEYPASMERHPFDNPEGDDNASEEIEEQMPETEEEEEPWSASFFDDPAGDVFFHEGEGREETQAAKGPAPSLSPEEVAKKSRKALLRWDPNETSSQRQRKLALHKADAG